eukprot:5990767-Pyramimonas_sp.AAC.1
MHQRCIGDVGDVSTTPAWRKSGSASSCIADASAMRRDPPTPSARTPATQDAKKSVAVGAADCCLAVEAAAGLLRP